MSLIFRCHRCQQRLSVGSRKAGEWVACPKCQARIVVPHLAPASIPGPPPLPSMVDVRGRSFGPAMESGRVSLSRRTLYAQGVLIAAVAAAGFGFGYLVGRGQPRREVAGADRPPLVTAGGRVRYRDSLGNSVGDAGAVVLAAPEAARPQRPERPSLLGLRPGDPPPPQDDPTLAAIRALGGAYVRADDQGTFELPSLPAGEYRLLVVSRHASRSAADPPRPEDLALLGRQFNDVAELLGVQQYRCATVNLRPGISLEFDFGPTR